MRQIDSLSRRLGPVFAEMACPNPSPAFAQDTGALSWPKLRPMDEAYDPSTIPAAAYKPAHGGYPGATLDFAKGFNL